MKVLRVVPRVPRRAVVLLLVLVCVVGVSGSLVSLVHSAATSSLAARSMLHRRLADDLLSACEAPIQYWLAHVSPRVVLPPEARSASATVLDDALASDLMQARILIVATDACGPDRINVSTSPLDVIADSLGSSSPEDIDSIRSARREGRPPIPPVSETPSPGFSTQGDVSHRSVTFVNISPRWEMRITITVGDVTRTWRSLYVNAGERWELTMREVSGE